MPKQISDEEYAALLEDRQIARFIKPIYESPKTGHKARALIKEFYPDVQIPDYDIEQRLTERIDKEREEREERERKKVEGEQEKNFKEARAKTQKEYGFTDDGMADLEKFMVERNIGDYEVAASYRRSKEPKQSDADFGTGDHFWNHQKQDGFAEIAADPEAWGRKEILGALRRDQQRAREGR